jgi:hypothetical protein
VQNTVSARSRAGVQHGAKRSNRQNVPSEKQVRWSQLRVGLTVIFAIITLAFLIFLMTGDQSLPEDYHRTRDNAGGIRVALRPPRGRRHRNITGIRVVRDSAPAAPVEVLIRSP